MEKENLFLAQDFLSDIELYYTPEEFITEKTLTIKGDECKHIARVMRHKPGDNLYVTGGTGDIHFTEIDSLEKNEIICRIIETHKYEEELPEVTICIPRLKSQDRFEFALEKCVELGVTKFLIYTADRSVAKGEKLERWNKVTLAAMKQSLRSFLPEIKYKKSLSELLQTEGEIIYFDQKSKTLFKDKKSELKQNGKSFFLVFGPEGGLSEKELELFVKNGTSCQLTQNRLRAETAIITAVSSVFV